MKVVALDLTGDQEEEEEEEEEEEDDDGRGGCRWWWWARAARTSVCACRSTHSPGHATSPRPPTSPPPPSDASPRRCSHESLSLTVTPVSCHRRSRTQSIAPLNQGPLGWHTIEGPPTR
jgi:hypothetical protein